MISGMKGLSVSRRQFISTTTSALVCAQTVLKGAAANIPTLPEPAAEKLPRWRGFNLLEKFIKRNEGNPAFSETDFEWIAEFGFNFVRLPMSYRCWTSGNDWLKFEENE